MKIKSLFVKVNYCLLMLLMTVIFLNHNYNIKAIDTNNFILNDSNNYIIDYANKIDESEKKLIQNLNSKYNNTKNKIKICAITLHSLDKDDIYKVSKEILKNSKLEENGYYGILFVYSKEDKLGNIEITDNLKKYFSGSELNDYYEIQYPYYSSNAASRGLELIINKINQEKLIDLSNGTISEIDKNKDKSVGQGIYEYRKSLTYRIKKYSLIKLFIAICIFTFIGFLGKSLLFRKPGNTLISLNSNKIPGMGTGSFIDENKFNKNNKHNDINE